MRTTGTALFVAIALTATAARAQPELTGEVETELRVFPQGARYPGQHDAVGTSMALEPELYADWARGDHALLIAPFLRVDQHDAERSHADLREANLRFTLSRDFELRIGMARVFWGVTESKHLVDVVNQADLVEAPDAESKLGQPMLQLTWVAADGVLVDAFVMRLPGAHLPGRGGTPARSAPRRWRRPLRLRAGTPPAGRRAARCPLRGPA